MLAHEIDTLTAHANRDAHFSEIYHPRTGVRYGGVQECSRQRDPAGMKLWRSCRRQTWSATAYMRLLLRGVLGLRPGADGLSFSPCPAADIGEVRLEGLRYRGATLDVTLAADAGAGAAVTMRLDGVPADRVAPETTGRHKVELLPG
jgi:cellobiose phosphorylase